MCKYNHFQEYLHVTVRVEIKIILSHILIASPHLKCRTAELALSYSRRRVVLNSVHCRHVDWFLLQSAVAMKLKCWTKTHFFH